MYTIKKISEIPRKMHGGTYRVSFEETYQIITEFLVKGCAVAEVEFRERNLNYNNVRRNFQRVIKNHFKGVDVIIRGNRIFLRRTKS